MREDKLNSTEMVDNRRFGQSVQTVKETLEAAGTRSENFKLEDQVGNSSAGMGRYLGLPDMTEFLSTITQVIGELEQLEIAFNSLLGSKSKADELMKQVTELAMKTPYSLIDVAEAAKNLLALGVEGEKLIPVLEQVGDISMGNSANFSALALAFAQVSAEGVLTEDTLGKMINAAFNPLQAIADTSERKVLELKAAMEKEAITTEMVGEAFKSATSEGGRFYGMMENQSKSIKTAQQGLEEAIISLLNNVGKSQDDLIAGTYSMATNFVKNMNSMVFAIGGAIAAWGAYKTALLLYTTVQQAVSFVDTIRLIMMFRKELGLLTAAQQVFNAVSKANVYIAIGSAILGVITAIGLFSKQTDDATRAAGELESGIMEEGKRVNELASQLLDVNLNEQERKRIFDELKSIQPQIVEGIDEEAIAYDKLTEKVIEYNDELVKRMALASKKDIVNEAINLKMKVGVDLSTAQADLRMQILTMRSKLPTMDLEVGRYNPSLRQNSWGKIDNTERQRVISEFDSIIENSKGDWEKAAQDISIAFKGRNMVGEKHFKGFDFADIFKSNKKIRALKEEMSEADKAIVDANAQLKNFEETFKSVFDKPGAGKNEKQFSNMQEEIKAAYADVVKLKRELSDLYSGKADSINYDEDIINKTSELNAATAKLGRLTNTNPNASRNGEAERQQSIANQLFQLQQKNKQDEIDLIADEAERKRTQILFDYDKEYALILKEEKKLRDLQGGKLTKEESTEIAKSYSNASTRRDNSTAEVEKELEKARKEKEEAERAKADAEKQSYNDYYKAYGDYSEKKKAIISDYDEKISKAETAGEKAILGKERQNNLQELDRSMIEQTALWTNLFSDAGKQTSGFIKKTIAEAEQLMQYLAGVEGADIPVGIGREELEALKKDPEQIKRIIEGLEEQRDALNQRNPFMALIQGFKDLQDAASNTDLSKATKDQKMMSGTQSIISGMQGVSSVLGEVEGALESMGAKSSEVFNGVAEVLGKTASMASTGASIAGPWGAAAGAAMGLATSLISVFAKSHDNKREKEIEKLQDQVEVLDKAYDKLGETIEKSYSKDASNLIGQQNQMLEQQKVLIQGQISEEQDKKKADSGRIEEWQAQIEEINNTIAQNKVAAQDAIFGADVKSAIDEFAQAYADAWAAGNDRAKAMKDVVKNMIKGVIVEMLKSDFAPTVQKIRDRIESMLADGIISSYEQLELDRIIEAEAAKADQKYAWADNYMKEDEAKETSQESSKGGFETMSQDSADELNGRFTALQIAGEELKYQSGQQSAYLLGMSVNLDVVKLYTQGVAVSVSEIKDIALTSMNHLSTIEKNTRQLYQMNERLGNIERNTKGL